MSIAQISKWCLSVSEVLLNSRPQIFIFSFSFLSSLSFVCVFVGSDFPVSESSITFMGRKDSRFSVTDSMVAGCSVYLL